jgi:hypothetical protein
VNSRLDYLAHNNVASAKTAGRNSAGLTNWPAAQNYNIFISGNICSTSSVVSNGERLN